MFLVPEWLQINVRKQNKQRLETIRNRSKSKEESTLLADNWKQTELGVSFSHLLKGKK